MELIDTAQLPRADFSDAYGLRRWRGAVNGVLVEHWSTKSDLALYVKGGIDRHGLSATAWASLVDENGETYATACRVI